MAIFGRRSARQRLRSAARESLTIPAFSAPVDCSAWVLGGVWPAELATITPATSQLADYLNADLQRIASSANEKLHAIGRSGLSGQARQTAEARVINVARAFAVLRVESTVRQLHKEALDFGAEYAGLNPASPPVQAPELAPADPAPSLPADPPPDTAPDPARGARHRQLEVLDVKPDGPVAPQPNGPLVIDHADNEPPTTAMPVEPVVVAPVEPVVVPPVEPAVVPLVEPVAVPPAQAPQDATAVIPAVRDPVVAPVPQPRTPPAVTESDEQRLQRLLAFVARQEPGLRWAIGTYPDGRTLLVTDIASGWIPSGIELPAGVQLLEPDERTGTATEMLGASTASASYHPGDRLGWASDFGATTASVQPRELAPVEDLGWQLSEATHWRDGLPRMANTLVKAGAAGTGVVDAEIDLLRVHLDTARYQLLAQYPAADAAVVLNCMLLAATEGIAVGDGVSANYHYSWFRTLSTPQSSQWDPQA